MSQEPLTNAMVVRVQVMVGFSLVAETGIPECYPLMVLLETARFSDTVMLAAILLNEIPFRKQIDK